MKHDAEGGDGETHPPWGQVNNGVYLRRNADCQVLNDADNRQANVDPGAGDRPPLERNPKEDNWTKTGTSFTATEN